MFTTSTVLPLAPRSTSPGLIARPPGMFSVEGTTPMTRTGTLSSDSARMAPITAAPPAMSTFIRSMPSAGLMEMPPVSNVMPLPTRPSVTAGGRVRRLVPEHDHARRLRAALRDAEQQPHPELRDPVFVEDLHCQPGVRRERRGALGKHARREHVGGLVGEQPRIVGALPQHATAVGRGL